MIASKTSTIHFPRCWWSIRCLSSKLTFTGFAATLAASFTSTFVCKRNLWHTFGKMLNNTLPWTILFSIAAIVPILNEWFQSSITSQKTRSCSWTTYGEFVYNSEKPSYKSGQKFRKTSSNLQRGFNFNNVKSPSSRYRNSNCSDRTANERSDVYNDHGWMVVARFTRKKVHRDGRNESHRLHSFRVVFAFIWKKFYAQEETRYREKHSTVTNVDQIKM